MVQKKSPDDWINAAIRRLRTDGIHGVRVEVLAADLEVSKGGFYWYFNDRQALLDALLESWEQETDTLLERAGTAKTARMRVETFFEAAMHSRGFPPDAAIFAWAKTDTEVARRVNAVDHKRLAFFAQQLNSTTQAEVFYNAVIGWLDRSSRDRRSVLPFHTFLKAVLDQCFSAAPSPRLS